jgi:hypothetical protein
MLEKGKDATQHVDNHSVEKLSIIRGVVIYCNIAPLTYPCARTRVTIIGLQDEALGSERRLSGIVIQHADSLTSRGIRICS